MKAESVNVSILQELVGNDQSVIDDILQEFHISALEIAAALQAACEAQRYDQASDLAHKLKSSARSVGALKLGNWCEQIEHAGRNGETGKLNDLLLSFNSEITAVANDLTNRFELKTNEP